MTRRTPKKKDRGRLPAAALVFAMGVVPALALGQSGTDNGGGVTAERSPAQKDFLGGLGRHLAELVARGIVTPGAEKEIDGEFREFAGRDPRIYEQSGFEYAIPRIEPLAESNGASALPEPKQAQSRTITEIIGTERVTEDGIAELFRRMFAAKKADGASFEMFVREYYGALVANGSFRKPDGTIDKEAVSDDMQRKEGVYTIVASQLKTLRETGRLKRVVDAVNHVISYSQRNGLAFTPAQVRMGLVNIESCVGATSEMHVRAYVESCGRLMTWIGDRTQPSPVEVLFFDLKTGEAGVRRTMAPWDAKYALDAYGPVFTDVQASANDNFWRDYFKLYVGTASAKEATLGARDSGELLKLEIAVGRTMKLILGYAQGTPFEGKKVGVPEVRSALGESRRLKAELEATASSTIKAQEGYADTMRGFEQVLARAKAVGVK